MNWEEMLVDALIIALISAAGVIIASLLANVINDMKGYKKIDQRIGNTGDKGTLTGQHEKIEKAINQGNGQVKDSIKDSTEMVLRSSNSILSKVEKINDHIIKEKAEQENSFKNLDKDQQRIMGHVEGIHALAKDWERTVSRNRELESKVVVLEEKVQKLTLELSRVNQDRSNDRDEQDLER